MAIVLLALLIAQPAAALERVEDFGENPGDLQMYLHRPAAFTDDLPLVVALHGCRQTAADFDDETGLTAIAEEISFLLLLPEQREKNRPDGASAGTTRTTTDRDTGRAPRSWQ